MAVDETGRFWFEGVSETGVSSLTETSESGVWIEGEAPEEPVGPKLHVVSAPLGW